MNESEPNKELRRRTLNTCQRLARLVELSAPEVIIQHEMNMVVPRLLALYGPLILCDVFGAVARVERNRMGICGVSVCDGRLITEDEIDSGLCCNCLAKEEKEENEFDDKYRYEEDERSPDGF